MSVDLTGVKVASSNDLASSANYSEASRYAGGIPARDSGACDASVGSWDTLRVWQAVDADGVSGDEQSHSPDELDITFTGAARVKMTLAGKANELTSTLRRVVPLTRYPKSQPGSNGCTWRAAVGGTQ